ncbi:hypothetical protein [Xenorhabdus sp. KJ12.1]|uniref:hypothetical protein n=1 Tax=Xenorhabdus sp. KJ12.1 TaxID=1851571 RepID=UPI000C05018E|nr:hypothetical protein [Xenorhabdus sp. KJ12.1]PHM65507.1 hypothetical protein Xekj_04261 [Xenorhabdus sp. KJ12.1]
MKNNVIELQKEINKLQSKAANELAGTWVIERQLLTLSIINYFLEKGDSLSALAWSESIFEWIEEDLSSEIASHSNDLDGWLIQRLEHEISRDAALEIIRSEMPNIEAMRNEPMESKETLQFTAEIELTDFVHIGNDKTMAVGKIFNDNYNRFKDGTQIRTSLVKNSETYQSDGYIKTQNSVYKIRHPNK